MSLFNLFFPLAPCLLHAPGDSGPLDGMSVDPAAHLDVFGESSALYGDLLDRYTVICS